MQGRALAKPRALFHHGHIAEKNRCTPFGVHDDVAEILRVARDADATDQELLRPLNDEAPARVGVVAADGLFKLPQRDIVGEHPLRVDLDLELLVIPAVSVDLGDAWHCSELGLDEELLERFQIRRADSVAVQGVLIYFAQSRGDRGHSGGGDIGRQAPAHGRQPLQ